MAPGLLSSSAWAALGEARAVVAADPTAAQARAIAAAGLQVLAVPPAALHSPQGLAEHLLGLVAGVASGAGTNDGTIDGSKDGTIVWIGSPDGDPGLAEALAVSLPEEDPPILELLVGSWDTPGARLLDAVSVMDRLRSPGGCPWDAEQTHASLTPYLIEEAYEAAEVLDQLDGPDADRDDAADELGDVLLQVLFHARVAAEHEEDPFDIDDVAAGLVAKLVRRHPHVFAGGDAATPQAVEANWELIKAEEKPDRQHPLDGIPVGMPELARARKVASRLRRAGQVEWLREWVEARVAQRDPGALLLEAVLDLHDGDVDASAALRHTLRSLTEDARELG